MYESLGKIFYSNPQAHHSEYLARFTSPSAVHLPLHIKQFNHDKDFQAFFVYTQDLVLLMERIYTQLAYFMNTLQDVTPIVRNQFALFCVIDGVQATSAIEGIYSTHREQKEILEGNVHDKHFSIIIKKYGMLITGQAPCFCSCQDVRDFYDEFAHVGAVAENPNNKLDGLLFRKEAVDVLSPSGKILHRGITPEEKIIAAISDALGFLNDKNCPALVRITVFHYLFVYIHPFYDGNGRTARFISSAYIAKHLHPLISLRLAVTINRRRKAYYRLLKEADAEKNCGDLTPFIYSFIEFIHETICDINRMLKRKMSQLQRFRRIIALHCNVKGIEAGIMDLLLQASAFYGHGLAMDEIMSLTGKSRNTIKAKFERLPVRAVSGQGKRKKFYKLDWGSLRYTAFKHTPKLV